MSIVLLVDDHEVHRAAIRYFLRQRGHEVVTADDGVQALERVRESRPDLILLDLNRPRKNGREVLSEIKTDPNLKRIPVLVMTTSRADQDIQKAYSLNANCYITKPMDLDEFLRIVKSIEDFWLRTVTLPKP